ncbi:hypothetical protein [Fodinibius salsisoli]|uniref:Uncharacterized protein n=1 Tax=Fodinibius salsisoli TaxID=2820877 RepID=A0ABT3PHF9_9BACT|nr:hypothetical protein [Fodinibius salsisoli]MCW9705347.1 hypothetical protein [Fodinibius salsisoli]
MDINKLNNIGGSNVNRTNESTQGEASEKNSNASVDTPVDKVSLRDYPFRNNDQLFAKLELEKLNQSSSQQFKKMKGQVSAYLEASDNPDADVQQTELGQKLNDPSVWGNIANKIIK